MLSTKDGGVQACGLYIIEEEIVIIDCSYLLLFFFLDL